MTAIENLPLDKSEKTPPGSKKKIVVQTQSKCETCLEPLTLPSGLWGGTEVTEYIRLVTF